MNLACGIDFGTSNCAAAVLINDKPKIVELDPVNDDARILSSKIYINHLKEILVGQAAVNRFLKDLKSLPATPPQRHFTGRQLKLIKEAGYGGFGGVQLVPEIVEVDTSGRGQLLQSLKSVLTSKLYTGTEVNVFQNDELYTVKYSLEELLGFLLVTIKRRVEETVNGQVEKTVIGRPVRYVGNQANVELALKRMQAIAEQAGFKEVVFEYEPVGAALNYGINLEKPGRLLVFDFGGGTLDVCVMQLPEKKILAVNGRPIGGDLLNSILFIEKLGKCFGTETTFSQGKMTLPEIWRGALQSWFRLSQMKTMRNLASLENLLSMADNKQPLMALEELMVEDLGFQLYQDVDQAKVALSSEIRAKIGFKAKRFEIEELVLRKEFEELVMAEVDETRRCLEEVLNEAKIKAKEIDFVITTGGSSSIPIFQKLLFETFGREKVTIGDSFTAVAKGLAVRAGEVFS